MRLLVITQKMDAADRNLGFFVRWIEQLSERAEITVIANEVHAATTLGLPQNVHVCSLGKERGASRGTRFLRYQRLLLQNLPQVNGVFFHMCPEYVLAAHILPHWFGKKTLLWYVHKQKSFRLWLAAKLVDKIFTASKESCRLPSRKVEVVGHGIDTELFKNQQGRADGLHLVTVGRISPVKDVRTLILGFLELQKKFPEADLSIVGEPITPADRSYEKELKRIASAHVRFASLPFGRVFESHPYTVFVHASKTGSMDKAVLEALAAGLPVFTSSEAFPEKIPGVFNFKAGDPIDLAEQVGRAFLRGEIVYNTEARTWVREHHDLSGLIRTIIDFYTMRTAN